MKNLPSLLKACLALGLISFLHGQEAAPLPPQIPLPAGVQEISPAEMEALIRDRPNIAILDVRIAEERQQQGQIRGSQHLDIIRGDFLEHFRALRFDPAQPCIIYCALGGRARKAAAQIAPLGYKHVFLPKGGFNAWKRAGKAVEGGMLKAPAP